jgi:ATP-dependent RNA helicase DeaD
VVAEKPVPAKPAREQSAPHKTEITKPGPSSEKPVPPKPAREQAAPHQTEIPAARPVSEKPVAAKPVREQIALHQTDIPKPGTAGEKRISAKPAREETALHRTEIPEPGSAVEKRVPAKPVHEQTAPHQTEIPQRPEPGAHHPLKASRRTPDGQTRLFMNVGAEMGVSEADVVGVILGETGLPRKTVGTVDVRERHLFVDVASEHANSIIAKLTRAQIKGRKAKVKVA